MTTIDANPRPEAGQAFAPVAIPPGPDAAAAAAWTRRLGLDPVSLGRAFGGQARALAQAGDAAALAVLRQVQRQLRTAEALTALTAGCIARIELSGSAGAPATNRAAMAEATDQAMTLMQRLADETLAAAADGWRRAGLWNGAFVPQAGQEGTR